MGLLDNFGSQVGTYLGDKENLLNLASGFASMSGNPNTASIMAGIQGQRESLIKRRDAKAAQDLANTQTEGQRNATSEFLIGKGGEFAKIGQALKLQQITAKQAIEMAKEVTGRKPVDQFNILRPSEVAALNLDPNKTWQQNSNGNRVYELSSQESVNEFNMMSEADRIAAGLPEGSYQTDSFGKTYSIGKDGTKVIVNTGEAAGPDNEKLFETLATAEGKVWGTYVSQAGKAASTMSDINMLGQLLKLAPTGPVTGFFAERFKGFSSTADAIQGIIARLAPSMRVEGSGSTSDIEVQKMMDSLGSLRSSPEANDLIHTAFKAKLTLDVQRGKIVNKMQNKEITVIEGRKALQKLNSQSILSEPLAALLYGTNSSASNTPTVSGGGTGNIAAGNAALQAKLAQQQSQLAALKAKLNLPSQQLSTQQLGPQ
jgi:hypothetical protein